MAEEQCQQQPHHGLMEDFIELSEGLSESSYMCVVVFPREKEEILPFITEEDNGEGVVEEHQENNLPLPPTDSVYILPTPAAQSTPKTPAPKAHASPSLPMLQNFKKIVAIVQTFITTSKKMAAAQTAWHSGWFGCWFGHEAPGPRHSH